jgi:hypothetical protein
VAEVTAVDPLFPLPESDFLFVHTATRYSTSTTRREADDNGWRTPIDMEAVPHDDTRAYVATPNYRDVGVTQVVFCVILVPRTFVVRFGDVMHVPEQQGLYPDLTGWMEIEQVRPNPSHTRVMCRRSQIGSQVEAGTV